MLNNLLFLIFVALAVYTQNLTGFALALVLLGLVGATDVFPLPDVVNAVSIIVLVNATLFLYKRRALRLERSLWPVLLASMAGTLLGVAALAWIMGNAYEVLRLLLGLSIVYCAWMLWRRAVPRSTSSTPASFASVGLLSGLMNGLFAAGGPPLVFLIYRQPWSLARIQESLIFINGMAALLRLAVTIPTVGFNQQSLKLSLIAVPVVLLVTTLSARRAPPLSPRVLRLIVCLLLVATGLIMVHASMFFLTSA
ncbi:sulfite exporter TauE/SafE family protein [Pusillimonas sp. SM2304]|uniref:sulfite exporter TauE/SafE family protein n=1 Tax=Pusillimonas sp. SM2304 TaxID=3073241 RepID=UPI00287552BB|nr:sulfite exporter TauE/SafE family protein [Pusillimonas sp. SM2304]MDS1141055.1 sulfite exporter TauE/SafE family protein [Pusillimonas sp. SM2304]